MRRALHAIAFASIASLSLVVAPPLAPPAAAFQPMEGRFVAARDCPALQRIRDRASHAGARVEAGESYSMRALNRAGGDHALVAIPGAQPAERWVALACGEIVAAGAAATARGAASDFAPIFRRDGGSRGGAIPAPALGAFDRAVLEICGPWGSRPSRAAFRALFDKREFAPDVAAIATALDFTVRDRRLSPGAFAEAMTALWFAEDGFRHVFCGEPGEERLGGLHYKGRFLEAQERGFGGLTPCRAGDLDPPLVSLGFAYRTPSGGRAIACPKSFSTRLDARALLVEATRAFRAKGRGPAGERMCLHRLGEAHGASDYAVLVERSGAIRTFYPTGSPSCDGGAPARACLCGE
ncbi:MAG: EndoU domain-containing protein [Microvirga sp.]|nr:EndoU domain-containing protein [Microvirga sp.]